MRFRRRSRPGRGRRRFSGRRRMTRRIRRRSVRPLRIGYRF